MSDYTAWTTALRRKRPYDVIAEALAGDLGPHAQHYASVATIELVAPDDVDPRRDNALDQRVSDRMLELARDDEREVL